MTKCNDCGKSFKNAFGLNMHQIRAHNGKTWSTYKPKANRKPIETVVEKTINYCPCCGFHMASIAGAAK